MLISIVVPVYKVEEYIHRCVDSILNQSFNDFELILVDDGSPDKCGQICDEYAKKDKRIKVIHRENGGLSAARNSGIEWALNNSDSQWITFIDSDDWIHADYLKVLLDACNKLKVDVSISNFFKTSGDILTVSAEDLMPTKWKFDDFFMQNSANAVIAWGKLYKKKLFKNIRYPEGKLHEDEFTTYKVLYYSKSVAVIKAPLYNYFMNDDGIMRSAWSPKRLHSIEANQQAAEFLKDKNLNDLYVFYKRRTVFTAADHISFLRKTDESELKKWLPSLEKNYKKLLFKYRKDLPYSEYQWVYRIAYPKLAEMYWRIYGICSAVKSKQKKNKQK